MSKTVGIAGGGVMGRVLALELVRHGWKVSLFEKDGLDAENSAARTSAGMIAPSCEMESAEERIAHLGRQGLLRWKALSEELDGKIYFHHRGSVVVAHPGDRIELDRLKSRISSDMFQEISHREIHELEPELNETFQAGLYIPDEAHLDPRGTLAVLANTLKEQGAELHFHSEVTHLSSHTLATADTRHTFDWVVDCRGLGAAEDQPELRGVRGEVVRVQAPEVNLTRPVRLMHPRYPIYIVPQPNHRYIIGATAIESADLSPITVRSALELLSALYAVHTGFAEAHIEETDVNCRPAFPDNSPRVIAGDGIMTINGLYRHGWLISPMLAAFAVEKMETGAVEEQAVEFVKEAEA